MLWHGFYCGDVEGLLATVFRSANGKQYGACNYFS